jgi:hypothetical protein
MASSLIGGVGDDAAFVAAHIAQRSPPNSAFSIEAELVP